MIEIDLTAEDLACALLHRAADDEWRFRDAGDRKALAPPAPDRRIERGQQRARLKRALAVVTAARKAGLPIRRATVEGVDFEFGQQEPSAPAPDAYVNEWDRDLGAPSTVTLRS